jgi:23S rRNA (adenine1618-N6)-methyltransferase
MSPPKHKFKSGLPKVPPGKLHPRNRHQGHYDFARLLQTHAALGNFVHINEHGGQSIDFADPAAVLALNRALLQDYYDIRGWDIPPHNLCPPVPGRADYMHYLADLLASCNDGVIPRGKSIRVLDIGTGASCIYPLTGHSEYGWHFVATDINADSLANAQSILGANPELARNISLRLQPDPDLILNGIIHDDEWFDLTLCNPPFHASQVEASAGTQRKWKNLGKQDAKSKLNPVLNFSGQDTELWCAGGEEGFIGRMISESKLYATRCFWFTSLVSKSASLPGIHAALENAGVKEHKTIAMSQGQKKSRFVAWTFLNPAQQAGWRKLRW